jgi:hypothetical protein
MTFTFFVQPFGKSRKLLVAAQKLADHLAARL